LAVNVALVIFLANFGLVVFNESYYVEQFGKNDVYSKVPEAENVLENVFGFFKGKEELNSEVFKENEISHMMDVKMLINRAFYLLYFLIGLFILLVIVLVKSVKRNKAVKYIGFSLVAGGSIVVMVSLILFLLNFSNIFTNFHLIFFPQGNWVFPSGYVLIKLFPEAFFYDISFRIVKDSVVSAVLLVMVGFYLFRRK